MLATLLTLWVGQAHAAPVGLFRDGASAVRLDGARADLKLFRGPATGFLPTVEARVPVAGQAQQRPILAVVDLAGGGNRVSARMAESLGMKVTKVKIRGVSMRLAQLPRLSLDGLELTDVVVEVVEDAPGLVIGFSSFEELATAVLPSQGVVRVVPARRGSTLVQSLGEPIATTAQPLGVFKDREGIKRLSAGMMRVPVRLKPTGGRELEGVVHVRTDRPTSTRPTQGVLGRGPAVSAQVALAGDFGPAIPLAVQSDLRDPDGSFGASLGNDLLFAYDIAVHPAGGAIALRRAASVQWNPTATVAAAFAVTRFEQLEALLGPPGAGRNLEVGDALWFSGQVDAALPYYRQAARRGGRECRPHLTLALRELAWAGPNLATDEVSTSLTQTLEAATVTPDCERSNALLIGVYRLLGEGAKLAKLQASADRDGTGAFMRALVLLNEDPEGARDLLTQASSASVPAVDLQVARAVADGGLGDVEGVLTQARAVSSEGSDHPLTTAFGILAAALRLDDPAALTAAWLQADPDHLPARLAHAVASGKPPQEWPDGVTLLFADSPQIRCQLAVHHALSGRPGYGRAMLDGRPMPTLADWWTARAAVAAFEGDVGTRSEALLNLRLRFPLAPLGTVGTARPMGP